MESYGYGEQAISINDGTTLVASILYVPTSILSPLYCNTQRG